MCRRGAGCLFPFARCAKCATDRRTEYQGQSLVRSISTLHLQDSDDPERHEYLARLTEDPADSRMTFDGLALSIALLMPVFPDP